MEGSVPNLLVLPDTGGLHQCGDLSIDDYFFQVLSNFIQTPSVSEAPHREGYHGFPHWFLLVSILPRVAVLLDIHFPHLLFHAFSLGGIGIDKVLLLPPKGPSPFLTRQATYSTVHVGVWALDMD